MNKKSLFFICFLIVLSQNVLALDDTPDPMQSELEGNPVVVEQQRFTTLVQAIDMLYSMNTSYKTLSNKAIINSLLVDPTLVKNNYRIVNAFGGEVQVQGVSYTMIDKKGKELNSKPYNGFSITYTHLSKQACEAFFSNTLKYFQSITVNDNPAFHYNEDMKPQDYMVTIKNECLDDNLMNFIRAK